MKTKEELNALKEEIETVSKKLCELTEEELSEVTGGIKNDDPEVLNILKDAAAAAIYRARGANGVILVE